MNNLMDYLPADYFNSMPVTELQKALYDENNKLEAAAEDWEKQLFVQSATWGLKYWEQMYGIQTIENKSLEERREEVIAKIRGAGTTTKAMVKNLAESFVRGEVEIIEYPKEYRFEIVMKSIIGTPPNLEALEQAIGEIKPAHLDFAVVAKFNTWQMIQDKKTKWHANKTWNQLREEVL